MNINEWCINNYWNYFSSNFPLEHWASEAGPATMGNPQCMVARWRGLGTRSSVPSPSRPRHLLPNTPSNVLTGYCISQTVGLYLDAPTYQLHLYVAGLVPTLQLCVKSQNATSNTKGFVCLWSAIVKKLGWASPPRKALNQRRKSLFISNSLAKDNPKQKRE